MVGKRLRWCGTVTLGRGFSGGCSVMYSWGFSGGLVVRSSLVHIGVVVWRGAVKLKLGFSRGGIAYAKRIPQASR